MYDEASAIDSNSDHIDLSVLIHHFDVFEHEEMKKGLFDSTDKTCYISKNPKLGTERYHKLSRASQRALQHVCDTMKTCIDSLCYELQLA